ncbi:MAG: Uma2 family endonuclease [Anaerolineae bacterium]
MAVVTDDLVARVLSVAEPAERSLRRQMLDVLLSPAQPVRMSYEEFLAWTDEDTLAEWVNREVLMTSPASMRHQSISHFLAQIVGVYVEEHNLGALITAPFQMKLASSGREPDLLFVAAEHLHRLLDTYLAGPADLAVEIISPESVGRDRGDKFYEYEQAGIPEYWLLDPQARRAEFYQLDPAGVYQLIVPDQEGIYRSAVVPGFWLRVSWLWQQPLPRVLSVLRELGVV